MNIYISDNFDIYPSFCFPNKNKNILSLKEIYLIVTVSLKRALDALSSARFSFVSVDIKTAWYTRQKSNNHNILSVPCLNFALKSCVATLLMSLTWISLNGVVRKDYLNRHLVRIGCMAANSYPVVASGRLYVSFKEHVTCIYF